MLCGSYIYVLECFVEDDVGENFVYAGLMGKEGSTEAVCLCWMMEILR